MRLRASLAAGMAATLIAAPALAQSPYLCTGVSENERMEAEGFDHSLRLVFAQPDGHYLADVHTRIADSAGNVVVEATCPGPWLLANLPAGTYDVQATFRGETKTASVAVDGTAGQEQFITF